MPGYQDLSLSHTDFDVNHVSYLRNVLKWDIKIQNDAWEKIKDACSHIPYTFQYSDNLSLSLNERCRTNFKEIENGLGSVSEWALKRLFFLKNVQSGHSDKSVRIPTGLSTAFSEPLKISK